MKGPVKIPIAYYPVDLMTRPQIFVFGSNMAGRHGKGSALEAARRHGAIRGCFSGPQGNSYAIPTKDRNLFVLPVDTIGRFVNTFLRYAADNPDCDFNVVAIGCGEAGYKPEQIAPLFIEHPSNVLLPPEFVRILYP